MEIIRVKLCYDNYFVVNRQGLKGAVGYWGGPFFCLSIPHVPCEIDNKKNFVTFKYNSISYSIVVRVLFYCFKGAGFPGY